MKGTIIKSEMTDLNHKSLNPNSEWEVEYKKHTPHAGISKKGTGPGVGKKIFETKRLPLHPSDIQFAEEGKEIEFEIDRSTPLEIGYGQEQYTNTLLQMFGESAKIIHPIETWERLKNKIIEDGGWWDNTEPIDWFIEQLKRQGYEIPKKKI